MLVILYTKNQYHDYILDGLKNNNKIRTIAAERPNISIFIKIFRKILSLCKLSYRIPLLYFKKSFLEEIAKIEIHDKILIQGIPDINELWTLANILPYKIETHLWYWNPLNKEYKKKKTDEIKVLIKQLHSLGYTISTYDKDDAILYNIILRNQFYRYPSIQKLNGEIVYDFYFLGYSKDRENEIEWLKKQLQDLKYRVEFKIVKNKTEEISYYENIENILKSKCIVDLNQKGQRGLTLRPLEALFWDKKLITNNQDILQADFYHPNNIFILGKDNMKLLTQFMDKDFVKFPDYILNSYDIDNWINYYL